MATTIRAAHVGGPLSPSTDKACDFPGCEEKAVGACDPCGKRCFCGEHGHLDVDVPGICSDAAVCWVCLGREEDE